MSELDPIDDDTSSDELSSSATMSHGEDIDTLLRSTNPSIKPPNFSDIQYSESSSEDKNTVTVNGEAQIMFKNITEEDLDFIFGNEHDADLVYSKNFEFQGARKTTKRGIGAIEGDELDHYLDLIEDKVQDIGTHGICAHCNIPIIVQSSTFNGKVYHIEHFFCTKCHEVIEDDKFVQDEGQPWCKTCAAKYTMIYRLL